jgi:hypothetical protein
VPSPEIQSELIERATDIEGYLGRRIARQVP